MKYLALMLILLLSGCAAVGLGTDMGIKLEEEQAKHAQKVKDVQALIVSGCGYDTGFIRGVYGDMYEYHVSQFAQDAADEEDLQCKALAGNKWEENQSLGLLIGGKLRSEFYTSKDVIDRIVKALPTSSKIRKAFGL